MKRILVTFLFLLIASQVMAQTAVRNAVQPFIDSGEIPGLVSILSNKGELTIECVGWADAENKIPMRPDTMFWIASMSKGITCAALMTLVDEGKISLDDPVEKYLPEFQEIRVGVKNDDGTIALRKPQSKICIRQLLCHTSGMPFISPQMQQFGIDVFPPRKLASTFVQVPLLSEPGTRYQYSNMGIDTASAIIEVVAGKPFDVYIQEKLFNPLEMKDTGFWPNKEQLQRLAKTYRVGGNKKCIPGNYPALTSPFDDRIHRFAEGGGGLFATPIDVIHFYQMIAAKGVYKGKRILSEKAVEAFSIKQTADNISNKYSLGMRIEGDWFGHDGALQTDCLANFKTNQARLYFVQFVGTWNPPVKAAWVKAAMEFLSK